MSNPHHCFLVQFGPAVCQGGGGWVGWCGGGAAAHHPPTLTFRAALS